MPKASKVMIRNITSNNRWQPISISKKMVDRLDEFLKTDEALEDGLTSRSDVITMLLRAFLLEKGLLNNRRVDKSQNDS